MADLAPGGTRIPVARDAEASPLAVRSSVQRGRIPPQGVQEIPFHWEDLLDGPRPHGRGGGEGGYCVYHRTEIEGDVRISHSTLVTVARDAGEGVRVDARVTVQRRAFLELMDRERAFTERLAARWRERLARRLVAQRAWANGLRRPRLVRAAVRVIRWEARLGMGGIDLVRRTLRGLVQVPDALVSRLVQTRAHAGWRAGRRRLLSGLRNPSALSLEQRGVLLFLVLALALGAVFLLGSLFALLLPFWATEYQRVVADATAAFLSAVALPLPTEGFVVATTLAEGPLLAFAGSFVGKMLGVYVLYLVGDTLHDKVAAATRSRPRMGRAVAWLQANADKHGFLILTLVNAVPFVPDVLLYAFALSGMRFNKYMGGIALGTTLKFGGIIAGVLLLGPERVLEFLESPF